MRDVRSEPLLGWRLWHVRERRGEHTLFSWSQRAWWPPRVRMQAECLRLLRPHPHRAPEIGHGCGIYAVRARARAEALLHGLPALGGPLALGLVSLWGRVIENVDGWRAEFAYPYDLVLVGGDDALARDLRRRYLVDVRLESL